jgi:serine/threonine-protein kinase
MVAVSLTSTPPDEESVEFGDLTLLRQLGHGAYFEVLLVEDPAGRRFALKRPLPGPRRPELLRLLADEGRVAARLVHPNIPRLVAAFAEPGALVFELLDGTTLDELLDAPAKPPPPAASSLPAPLPNTASPGLGDAAFLVLAVLDALGYVHDLPGNVVHRDVGPHNIVVTRSGDPALIDFGIAVDDDRERWTATGALRGTLGYLSPEAIRGDVVDHRADLFAVAALFYRLVVGRAPFAGRGPRPILNAVARGAFHPVDDPALQAFFTRGLAADPARRFASAADVVRAVHDVLAARRTPVDPAAARRTWARLVAPHLGPRATDRGPTLS